MTRTKISKETELVILIDSQWDFAVWLRKLKQGLCINLEAWLRAHLSLVCVFLPFSLLGRQFKCEFYANWGSYLFFPGALS